MSTLTCFWGTMAYTDSGGSGRPFLFLHGSGCDSEDWDAVLARLPSGPRYVCLDFRGHGASEAPGQALDQEGLADDVLALLDHLDLSDAVLVGHSLGGCVAMMAAPRTGRVAALILLEAWTHSRAEQAFRADRLYAGLVVPAIRRIEQKLEHTIRRVGAAAWERLGTSGSGFDAWSYLKNARIPIVEVYGEAGRTPDTEKQLGIPSNPGISFQWVAGAGHYLPQAEPCKVARICGEINASLRAP